MLLLRRRRSNTKEELIYTLKINCKKIRKQTFVGVENNMEDVVVKGVDENYNSDSVVEVGESCSFDFV